MTEVEDLVADYRWLPHRSPSGDPIQFVRLDRDEHRGLTFLEDQYFVPSIERRVAGSKDVVAQSAKLPASPVHFIFHSTFALSTLLVRAMDIPGIAMGLKEPFILNTMAELSRRGASLDTLLPAMLALLGRPFAPGEAVVIKASNVANVLIDSILKLRPEAGAILLYSPLPDYLRSTAKKGMWGRLEARKLFALLRRDNFLDAGFSDEELLRQTDLQIAGHAWLAHHAQFASLVRRHPRQIRILDSSTLIKHRVEVLAAVAQHFGLDFDAVPIANGPVFAEHSKEIGRAYDPAQRQRESDAVDAAHGEEIAMVTKWVGAIADHAGIPLELGAPLLL